MIRDLAWLAAGLGVLWLATALPAFYLGSEPALVFAGVAAGLCYLPGAATLVWCRWAFSSSAEQQLLAVMGGSAVRMLVVIGVGMALFHGLPEFHRVSFWFWVIGFYLATLGLEIGLVVGRQPSSETSDVA